MAARSGLDDLHDRIQSKLDELHADLKQLEVDVHAANQASSRARKDRIEGFKRALRDILQAAGCRPRRKRVELKVKCYCRSAPLVLAALLSAGVLMVPAATAVSKNADAIPPRIETLYGSGSYKAAAEALQTDIGRSPKDPSLYHWLGRCCFELHDFDRSISSWEHAVALDSARSDSAPILASPGEGMGI